MKKKTVAEWYQVSKKAAGIEGGWNNSDLELNAEISEHSDSRPYPEAMPFSAISKHLTSSKDQMFPCFIGNVIVLEQCFRLLQSHP